MNSTLCLEKNIFGRAIKHYPIFIIFGSESWLTFPLHPKPYDNKMRI